MIDYFSTILLLTLMLFDDDLIRLVVVDRAAVIISFASHPDGN